MIQQLISQTPKPVDPQQARPSGPRTDRAPSAEAAQGFSDTLRESLRETPGAPPAEETQNTEAAAPERDAPGQPASDSETTESPETAADAEERSDDPAASETDQDQAGETAPTEQGREESDAIASNLVVSGGAITREAQRGPAETEAGAQDRSQAQPRKTETTPTDPARTGRGPDQQPLPVNIPAATGQQSAPETDQEPVDGARTPSEERLPADRVKPTDVTQQAAEQKPLPEDAKASPAAGRADDVPVASADVQRPTTRSDAQAQQGGVTSAPTEQPSSAQGESQPNPDGDNERNPAQQFSAPQREAATERSDDATVAERIEQRVRTEAGPRTEQRPAEVPLQQASAAPAEQASKQPTDAKPAAIAEKPAASPQTAQRSGAAEGEHPALRAQAQRGIGAVLAQRGGSITLRLAPDALGSLKVQMHIDGGTVRMDMDVTTEQARQAMRSELPALQRSLESRGFTVERAAVHLTQASTPQSAAAQADPGKQGAGDQQQGQQRDAAQGESRGHAGDQRQGRRDQDNQDSHFAHLAEQAGLFALGLDARA